MLNSEKLPVRLPPISGKLKSGILTVARLKRGVLGACESGKDSSLGSPFQSSQDIVMLATRANIFFSTECIVASMEADLALRRPS